MQQILGNNLHRLYGLKGVLCTRYTFRYTRKMDQNTFCMKNIHLLYAKFLEANTGWSWPKFLSRNRPKSLNSALSLFII